MRDGRDAAPAPVPCPTNDAMQSMFRICEETAPDWVAEMYRAEAALQYHG